MRQYLSTKLKIKLTLGILLGIFWSSYAFAGAELARANNCISCHSENKGIVGPAFKDIAHKYAGKAGEEDKLIKKIIYGGGGVWGPIPMPANTQVSEEDAHKLVKWILSLK